MATQKNTKTTKTSAEIFAHAKIRTDAALARIAAKASPQEAAPADEPVEEDGHKEVNFFLANLVDYAIKDDAASMEAPMFSLATTQDMKLWTWKSGDGKKTVDVAPGFYGRATQHDKDLLIYCMSQIVAAINAGKRPSRIVRFTAYDYLTATNRPTRGGDYDRMKDALNRLQGTQITTSSTSDKSRHAKGFGFIDNWDVIEKSEKDGRMVAVEIELSRWLYSGIEAQEVLTINRDYFKLRKPLERRLYEIARKHVGKQASWEIGIEALRDKCGSTTAEIRNWRIDLKKVITADNLPDYKVELDGDTVRFTPKEAKKD